MAAACGSGALHQGFFGRRFSRPAQDRGLDRQPSRAADAHSRFTRVADLRHPQPNSPNDVYVLLLVVSVVAAHYGGLKAGWVGGSGSVSNDASIVSTSTAPENAEAMAAGATN